MTIATRVPSSALPFWTRMEGHLTSSPLLNWAIVKAHQQRKKLGFYRQLRRRRRDPLNLRNFQRKVTSQNGEDGILAEIFRRIGEGDKLAVEFGIEDGTECCTRDLFESRGWSGILLEGSPRYAEAARTLFAGRPVKVVNRFLAVETIAATFAEAGVPREPDLLVIDVDGNDYWLWEAILEGFRPRVVCIEYNARFAPPVQWVMPYAPAHVWDGTVYFGASLESMDRLARAHDYRLVGCEDRGSNAFFVRVDLVGDHFPDSGRGTAYHYAVPNYALGFGHPVRPPWAAPAQAPARAAMTDAGHAGTAS